MIQRPQIYLYILAPCVFVLSVSACCKTGHSQTAFSSNAPVTAICLTSNPQTVVSGSDEGLRLHHPDTLEQTKQISSEIEKHYSIVASPNGKRIAAAGGSPGEWGVVEIFSVPEFELIRRFERFDDVVTDVAWNSNDVITACSVTGNCCVMQLTEKQPDPFNIHSKSVLAVDVLTSGQIVSAGRDSSIRVWKPGQTENVRVLNNHVDSVNDIARRPVPQGNDNTLPMIVSVSDDATARFWQPTIGRMIRFARLKSIPTTAIWTHDGSFAIVGCRDGSINLIDPSDAKMAATLRSAGNWINDLVLAADDKTLFVADTIGIQRLDLVETTKRISNR